MTAAGLASRSIADMATAAGSSPSGGTTSPPSDEVTVEETDVTVTKSASSQGGVVAGSSNPIVYTVKVANVGTATTTGPVVVTDAPPPGTTLVSGSPACTGGPPACALVLKGSTITWTIPAGVVPGSFTPHLLGDGEHVKHGRDHHQHRHLERAELWPVGGHDLPDGYDPYTGVGYAGHPADRSSPSGPRSRPWSRLRARCCPGVGGRRPRRGHRGRPAGRGALATPPSPSRSFEEVGRNRARSRSLTTPESPSRLGPGRQPSLETRIVYTLTNMGKFTTPRQIEAADAASLGPP